MENIRSYFNAEKSESLIFIIIGIMAIGLGVYFISSLKKSFYFGCSAPLILIAGIQIVVGTTVYLRSPKDIDRVGNYFVNQKDAIKTIEIPRMQSVIKNFIWYRWIEIALIITGLICYLFFKNWEWISGIGAGLLIQASLLLLLDYFAEKRGSVYLNFLLTL